MSRISKLWRQGQTGIKVGGEGGEGPDGVIARVLPALISLLRRHVCLLQPVKGMQCIARVAREESGGRSDISRK